MQTEKVSQSCKVFELQTPHFKQKKGLGGRSTNHYNLSRYNKMIRVLLWLVKTKVFQYLPAPLVITGVVRVSRSEICEDSLVLAAVCCCTLTSAASAKCISVFLSGLSSKFLQPTHLQMDEHMIFAFESKTGSVQMQSMVCLLKRQSSIKTAPENPPRSTRSSSSGSLTVCSCSLCCVGGLIHPLCLFQF